MAASRRSETHPEGPRDRLAGINRGLRAWALGLAALWAGGALAQDAHGTAPVGCPPPAPVPSRALLADAQRQAADRGLLWRIHRDGRDSYLYGTLHAGRPQWLALGPRTDAALARSGALALEVNPTDPEVVAALRAASQVRGARSLPDELDHALRDAWARECLPAGDLAQGYPEIQVAQLAMAQTRRQGLFAEYGAEAALLMRSLRSERPVVGLESVQTQLSALKARSDAEAEALVRAALAEYRRPQTVAIVQRLTQAWERGDLPALDSYRDWCECLATTVEREAMARLVDGRNPAMADAITQLHARASVFAAVGVLHLSGPDNLRTLLQARGFTVVRVF